MPRNLIIAAIAAFMTFTTGVYLAYTYQKNYYEAKIARTELASQEAITKEKARGEAESAAFFARARSERTRTADYQTQTNQRPATQPVANSNTCFVPYGFIRLFNASATGDDTNPADTDATPSPVELTEVLSTIIENHGKYREASAQIESIRALVNKHKE